MRQILFFVSISLILVACNPSIMLKTGSNYQYSEYRDTAKVKEYKISPNDIIEFKIYTNDGFKKIDPNLQAGTVGAVASVSQTDNQYIVENDGTVKLPVLGRIVITGFTVRQAEIMLEDKYSAFYIKPFIVIRVLNKRVIVFPGSPGIARVIPLDKNNTTLIEALALAGGITQDGKARKVKLIRGDFKKPEVYLIDLSVIEGIKYADMILQSGDIIYVEPRKGFSRQFAQEVSPYITIISSLIIVATFVNSLTR